MNNFSYRNPTELIFGRGVLSGLGEKAFPLGKRALLVYGKESAKKYGSYQLVLEQLRSKGIIVVALGGVQENLLLSLARKGIALARENKVEFIVALGGGSVMDTAKVIAAGVRTEADMWDVFCRKAQISGALKLIAVVTVPASASEANQVAVITNDELSMKAGITHPVLYPEMAFLDPALTCTLPLKNTAYTGVDIMAHVMEAYFTSREEFSPVQDGYAEGLCRAVQEAMRRLLKDPADYDARAALMWAATLAWNGLGQLGIKGASVPCHMLGYPLSGLYGMVHGATLSVLLPAWLKHNMESIAPRLSKFGANALGLQKADAGTALNALRSFYTEIGAPVSLAEAGVKAPDINKLAEMAVLAAQMRGVAGVSKEEAAAIYMLAC